MSEGSPGGIANKLLENISERELRLTRHPEVERLLGCENINHE